MYKPRKRTFPIKYLKKGLLSDSKEIIKSFSKKKGKRKVKKPKISVHQKTGMAKEKAK